MSALSEHSSDVKEGRKPTIIASAFISSAPKRIAKKRPAVAKPAPTGSCRKFWTLGRCEYGESCKYTHSANPDVAPQAPPPASVCKKFWVDGRCDFGDNCKFPHAPNPAIDPATVEEASGLSFKKAMKLGGRALDLDRWMDPKAVANYCVAPPADGVTFHGNVQPLDESLPLDGVDAPSEDVAAELAALQRMLAPKVLAKVKRQMEHSAAANSSSSVVAHVCTCHLMPGFNAQTGEKLVMCFDCNTAALAEKKKALLAEMQPSKTEAAWVPQMASVIEDAPGEEKSLQGVDAMAALLDRIDSAKAISGEQNSEAQSQATWAVWEQWQKDNGLGSEEEEP